MENPEEILHSLEEFAKMKPKDIPRELEEYLKFVAKTGDPVYQWSAIKILFREKLINVITEFYESCSSMEIPPCPNVEMFNYDLMKNFILEKLDTFASAPFTLQRICELLTSPRKEYTRIDKYMRALEKNILVVSTMEPGGRRTENGDGIMNGIESDHDHVPEPGNEINVEEMDDSPSWPQNIQTNNHISEHISFENTTETTETSYHVSSSSQEIVCVQYVSLATESQQIQNEEQKETDISVTIKEADISVTITPVNKDEENQDEATTSDTRNQHAEDVQKETTLEVNKTVNEPEISNDMGTKMDIQQPTESLENGSGDDNKTDKPSDPLSNEILSSTTSEKPSEELDQPQTISLESENAETENISPETSVTSSENSPSEPTTTSDVPLNEIITETISSTAPEVSEEKIESRESEEKKEIVEDNTTQDIDSTTEPTEDAKTDQEITKDSENTNSEEVLPHVAHTEEPTPVQEKQESAIQEDTPDTETFTELNEPIKTDTPTEVSAEKEVEPISEEILESKEVEESKCEEPTDLKSEDISSVPNEKETTSETPMEVDVVPEELSGLTEKDKPAVGEPENSEPPV